MIGSTCPGCGHTGTHPTRAVGRFSPDGPYGFAGEYPGAPLRRTREEAQADVCAYRVTKTPAPDSGADAGTPGPTPTNHESRSHE